MFSFTGIYLLLLFSLGKCNPVTREDISNLLNKKLQILITDYLDEIKFTVTNSDERLDKLTQFIKENTTVELALIKEKVDTNSELLDDLASVKKTVEFLKENLTEVIHNDTIVRAGFEDHHGRLIRRTISSDPTGSYKEAMGYCEQFHAVPFIPRTEADHSLYREVVEALGRYMWLPANDRASEGTLMWHTTPEEEVAQADIALLDWYEGHVMYDNTGSKDCLFYGCCYDGQGKLYLARCTDTARPPICELSK